MVTPGKEFHIPPRIFCPDTPFCYAIARFYHATAWPINGKNNAATGHMPDHRYWPRTQMPKKNHEDDVAFYQGVGGDAE